MYKVTFEINNVIQTFSVMFDALIASLWLKKNKPELFVQKPSYSKEELFDFSKEANFPIEFDKEMGVFKASYVFIENSHSQFIVIERKRWNEKHQHLINVEKLKPIDTQRGEYKAASIPRFGLTCSKAVAYFCGDKEQIERLLNECVGIGKKTSKSYGWIKSFLIEKAEGDFYDNLLRPLPLIKANELKFSGKVIDMRLTPPYHQFVESQPCVAPII